MLSSNTVLQNRYKIIQLLGQGGMGAVYMAIDQRLGHQIALKQMFHAQNEMMAQAFEREARILARLNHRCLPKVSDHFSEGDSRYLVMQYIEGVDLGELLENNQSPFAPEKVLDWADSLLDALEYLHHHEPPILHRDVKPQNLKINPRGELYLLDFGLAKDTATNYSNSLSSPSVVGYSLSYSPLEQIDRQITSPETDIYATCATLYHLLTNELPADALARICSKADSSDDPLIPANQINPQVPAALADALRRGMTLRREDRPNAAQLRKLLKNLKDGEFNQLPTEPLAAERPVDQFRLSSHESLNNLSVPSLPKVAESNAQTAPNTQTGFSPQTSPKAVKSGRFLSPLVIAAIGLPILGVGIGGAMIGYNKFVSAPVSSAAPSPAATVQNTPVATPTPETSTPPADTANQKIDQAVKPSEQKTATKTITINTPAPKTASTQKTNPPIKKQSPQKERTPPVIIPQ